MGHRNKDKIDVTKFRSMDGYRLPGNRNEWSCFYRDEYLKVYLSEAIGLKQMKYTIVGVCDGDDCYVRKQFDGHGVIAAHDLFIAIMNMEIIFRQNLYDLGMIDD